VDVAAEPLFDEEGEAPRVIDMRVREDDGVEPSHGDRELAVPVRDVAAAPLEEAAVEEDRAAGHLYEMRRTGDLTGRTDELETHTGGILGNEGEIDVARCRSHRDETPPGGSALRFGVAGEDDRQARRVLRELGRMPAAAAPLVQKVRERVLVLALMPGETEDHSLIFFHLGEDTSFSTMTTTPALPGCTVVAHPLVRHKMALLRDRATPTKLFQELVSELATLLAYEATQRLALAPIEVTTPLETTPGERLATPPILVPILRAGLGMVDGIRALIPDARVGHIGLYRDHDSLAPVEYYFKVPPGIATHDVFLLDPMLATGGSAANAVTALKRSGATRLTFLCLVAAPEGVRRLHAEHPDVPIFTAALDRELNAHGYILPGLGDAGDRLFGTK